jgi:hypothetical protein
LVPRGTHSPQPGFLRKGIVANIWKGVGAQ